MNLGHRLRKAADAIADFSSSEEQRYQKAVRLWWLWRHEYLAAKQIDPHGNAPQARAHLAAFGEDAHTLDTFDRFYRACLHNARTLAPAGKDRTQIEPDLIHELIEDAEHGFFPVAGNRTYQIDPPSEDRRMGADVQRVIAEKRTYGLAALILLGGLLTIWFILPDSAPRTSVQAEIVGTPPGHSGHPARETRGGDPMVASAPSPAPTSTPEPTPVDDAPPLWGSLAHGTVGNTLYDRAPSSLELGTMVYRVYAAEVYPGEPWQAEAQPGVAFWLPRSFANIVLCIPDRSVIEEVHDGDTITVRTGRSDVLRFTATAAQRVATHQTEVFDQRRAGITLLPCQAAGATYPVVAGSY